MRCLFTVFSSQGAFRFSTSLPSVMIASKFVDDVFLTNGYYAHIGGIRVEELNRLEAEFLDAICFSLFVTSADYDRYTSLLCDYALMHPYSLADSAAFVDDEKNNCCSPQSCKLWKEEFINSPCNVTCSFCESPS